MTATAQLESGGVFAELFERRRAACSRKTRCCFVTGRARFDEFAQRLTVSADDLMDLVQRRAAGRRPRPPLRIEVRQQPGCQCHQGACLSALPEPTAEATAEASSGGGRAAQRLEPPTTGRMQAADTRFRAGWLPGCGRRIRNGAAAVEIPLARCLARVRGEDRLIDDLRAAVDRVFGRIRLRMITLTGR